MKEIVNLIVQDEAGATIARMLKGRHVVVPSPNHFIPVSNPEGFNEAVAAFLKSVEA